MVLLVLLLVVDIVGVQVLIQPVDQTSVYVIVHHLLTLGGCVVVASIHIQATRRAVLVAMVD